MKREYEWGSISGLVEAPDGANFYKVALVSIDFRSTPVAIDAHWGADHAARLTLDIYSRALLDPRRFLAEERMEARHMPESDRKAHFQWAQTVAQEASVLGERIQEAVQIADQPETPIDVSGPIDEYLGLTQVGHEIAVAGLVSEGRSPTQAREIHAERTLQDFAGKWRFAPSRRLPTAARG